MQWLMDRFGEFGSRPAIIWQNQAHSYGWLRNSIGQWTEELKSQGVHAGTVAVIDGEASPDSLALFLSLAVNRNIIVPLDDTAPAQRREFIDIARPDVEFVFRGDDHWEIRRQTGHDIHPLIQELRGLNEPGLVLFSSGSTGKSKAILHNLSKLLQKFVRGGRPLTTLLFLRYDHIGGVNTLLHTLTSGGVIVSSRDRSPDSICRAIQDCRVQLLPTSPTFLNLLLISEAYKRYDLSALELITYGTETMPDTTLRRIREVLPWVECKQTYGLTELGIMRSKSMSSDCLWVKVGGDGYQTKVVDGTLWIKAETAMLGYLNAPSPFDEEGWFNTEDRVEVHGEYFRFLGRESNIINVGGQKVYPEEVENALLAMENVADVTVQAEKNPLTGQIVTARVKLMVPEDPAIFKQRMRQFCKGKLDPYKIPVRVEITQDDQVTERFKKWRKRLAC